MFLVLARAIFAGVLDCLPLDPELDKPSMLLHS